MNVQTLAVPPRAIVYPECDGEPMSENTKQFRWIVVLADNLAALFRDRADVFVSGNQFWFPVEGEPEIRCAPDVYVVFGRPKGDRPSYKQWEEGDVPMTVVFEVFSPGNDAFEMGDKLDFYDRHGAEEYYLYDPEKNRLQVFVRGDVVLKRTHPANGHVSPRLGIRFQLTSPEMTVHYPDGQPFLTIEDLKARYDQAQQDADQARQDADQARQDADQARTAAARLAALSRKARHNQATAEELLELERLEKDASS